MASQLDLSVLSELAGRLPFDPAFRARLAALAPAGQVAPANVRWTVGVGRLASYAVDARFTRLGIAPVGAWPGFSGLSGRIEGNEKGGRFSLSGRDASLDLPQIFPAPRLALGRFAPLGRVLGDPPVGMAGAFLSLGRVLPDRYPLAQAVEGYIADEHRLGRTLDYAVIARR